MIHKLREWFCFFFGCIKERAGQKLASCLRCHKMINRSGYKEKDFYQDDREPTS